MPESIPDKNVQVDGKVIGANSVIKMTAKTAIWIISGIVGIVMTILTWSYFDLRSEVDQQILRHNKNEMNLFIVLMKKLKK